MPILPYCFSIDSENYITIPVMRHFLESIQHEYKAEYCNTRQDCIQAIENYAAESPQNTNTVLTWVDNVLKQGIVELHIYTIENNAVDRLALQSGDVDKNLRKTISALTTPYLCKQPNSSEFKVIKYSFEQTSLGDLLSVSLYRTVYSKPRNEGAYTLTYPVHIDYYCTKGILIIRGKSKANLYPYTSDDSIPDFGEMRPIKFETLLGKALSAFRNATQLSVVACSEIGFLKNNLYHLLEKYTHTPAEIESMIQTAMPQIQSMMATIKNDVCHLGNSYDEDLIDDLRNFVEKYLSISYPDKKIFTRDREAYPLKLSAKDDEDSKVEQTAALEEPLQSKAVFFDNKKMMQRSRQCEEAVFIYKRNDSRYFGRSFKVSFASKAKCFILKFLYFTVEEDIQHVLVSLLTACETPST